MLPGCRGTLKAQKTLRAALNFAQAQPSNQNAPTISEQQHKRAMSFG